MSNVPFRTQITIGLCALFIFFAAVLFIFAARIILLWSVFAFILLVALALLIALPMSWLRHRKTFTRSGFTLSLGKTSAAVLCSLMLLLSAPYYLLSYQAHFKPLIVPQAVLSNGHKTVVFQGMSHVGSENFYKSVIYDLETALDQGYKLYYEGVQFSDKQANDWFNNYVAGGADLSDSYKELGSVCGISFQLDYFTLMTEDMPKRPLQHQTVDVTTSQLQQRYQQLMATDPDFAKAQKPLKSEDKTADPISTGISDYLNHANANQDEIIGVLCRGFVSWVLQPSATHHQAKDKLLVDFRNENLASHIQQDTAEKIYITYGSGHLPGIIKLLQQADPNWQLKSVKWMRAIAEPEHWSNQLE